MRTVRGTIAHNGNGSDKIPEGVTVTVTVKDCSIGCGPVKILGSANVPNVKTFPFAYMVSYDDSKVIKELMMGFRVDCEIKKGDSVEFINYSGGGYLIENGEIQDTVDFDLVTAIHN